MTFGIGQFGPATLAILEVGFEPWHPFAQDLALEFFQAMGQRKLRHDSVSYNSMISSCERGAQWQRALDLFQDGLVKVANVESAF